MQRFPKYNTTGIGLLHPPKINNFHFVEELNSLSRREIKIGPSYSVLYSFSSYLSLILLLLLIIK